MSLSATRPAVIFQLQINARYYASGDPSPRRGGCISVCFEGSSALADFKARQAAANPDSRLCEPNWPKIFLASFVEQIDAANLGPGELAAKMAAHGFLAKQSLALISPQAEGSWACALLTFASPPGARLEAPGAFERAMALAEMAARQWAARLGLQNAFISAFKPSLNRADDHVIEMASARGLAALLERQALLGATAAPLGSKPACPPRL